MYGFTFIDRVHSNRAALNVYNPLCVNGFKIGPMVQCRKRNALEPNVAHPVTGLSVRALIVRRQLAPVACELHRK
jgi:hypothetical protein